MGAVLSFAYNKPAPLVDANVSRVFSRLFNNFTPIDSPAGRKLHWQWAAEMVHPTNPRSYNSAEMPHLPHSQLVPCGKSGGSSGQTTEKGNHRHRAPGYSLRAEWLYSAGKTERRQTA